MQLQYKIAVSYLRTDELSLTNHKSPVSDAGVGQAPPGGREGIYWGL